MSGIFKSLSVLHGCWFSTGFTAEKVKALVLHHFELVRGLNDLVRGLERWFGS